MDRFNLFPVDIDSPLNCRPIDLVVESLEETLDIMQPFTIQPVQIIEAYAAICLRPTYFAHLFKELKEMPKMSSQRPSRVLRWFRHFSRPPGL